MVFGNGFQRFPEFNSREARDFLKEPTYPKDKIDKHLGKFVKSECANWDEHYKCCSDDQPCRVLMGNPCSYFERAVLGPPAYPYRLPGYDYEKMFFAYGLISPRTTPASKLKVRTCPDCGEVLSSRRRYCRKCSRNRAKTTRRQWAAKKRKTARSTVDN